MDLSSLNDGHYYAGNKLYYSRVPCIQEELDWDNHFSNGFKWSLFWSSKWPLLVVNLVPEHGIVVGKGFDLGLK